MISWFRLMSASRHAQLSPYPEFCSSWLLSSLPASLAGILQECTAGREAPQAGRQADPDQPKRSLGAMMKQIHAWCQQICSWKGPTLAPLTSTSWMVPQGIPPQLVAVCVSTLRHPWGGRAPLRSSFLGCPGFAVGSAGRAESAFCHPRATAVAWASQVLTSKST